MKTRHALAIATALLIGAAPLSAPVFAAASGGGGGSMPSGDPGSERPSLKAAERLMKGKHYEEALAMLDALRQKDDQNPDIYNDMGFCLRKLERLTDAEAYYKAALSLDADHKGALEYEGELFLMQNDLKGAEANLAKLAAVCPQGCDEYTDLAQAIADFKAAQG